MGKRIEKPRKEPRLVEIPAIVIGDKRKEPRPRCSECGRPTMSARIDKGKTPKVDRRSVGRPKKGTMLTRYKKIGSWCKRCDLFFYENGTPNYKMRPAVGETL